MKEIRLNHGAITIVDDLDYDDLVQHRWHYFNGYVARRKGEKRVFMHRELMLPGEGMEVDHINGDPLDNRRSNMRICTHSQNGYNVKTGKANKSGYKGVCWSGSRKKWKAQIKLGGYTMHLGYFDMAEDAARAYDKIAAGLYKEFARTNFPPEPSPLFRVGDALADPEKVVPGSDCP